MIWLTRRVLGSIAEMYICQVFGGKVIVDKGADNIPQIFT